MERLCHIKSAPGLKARIERMIGCGCAADGFLVQTGDPPGTADGFVDPGTGKVRTIPLEIMVEGDNAPIYGATLEVWN